MVFLRFQDCALTCLYCDTPDSFKKLARFRMEDPPRSQNFCWKENPISAEELTLLLKKFPERTLSLTGGEPLQHADFLESWLPGIYQKYQIFLETNGILPFELEKVIDYVHIVSMDIKLPSVTGRAAYWGEHEEFLKIARQKEVYVKVVISGPTDPHDLHKAISIVERFSPQIPFILQPVTPYGSVQLSVGDEQLKEFFNFSKQHLPDVRIIPQVHPGLGLM